MLIGNLVFICGVLWKAQISKGHTGSRKSDKGLKIDTSPRTQNNGPELKESCRLLGYRVPSIHQKLLSSLLIFSHLIFTTTIWYRYGDFSHLEKGKFKFWDVKKHPKAMQFLRGRSGTQTPNSLTLEPVLLTISLHLKLRRTKAWETTERSFSFPSEGKKKWINRGRTAWGRF